MLTLASLFKSSQQRGETFAPGPFLIQLNLKNGPLGGNWALKLSLLMSGWEGVFTKDRIAALWNLGLAHLSPKANSFRKCSQTVMFFKIALPNWVEAGLSGARKRAPLSHWLSLRYVLLSLTGREKVPRKNGLDEELTTGQESQASVKCLKQDKCF